MKLYYHPQKFAHLAQVLRAGGALYVTHVTHVTYLTLRLGPCRAGRMVLPLAFGRSQAKRFPVILGAVNVQVQSSVVQFTQGDLSGLGSEELAQGHRR